MFRGGGLRGGGYKQVDNVSVATLSNGSGVSRGVERSDLSPTLLDGGFGGCKVILVVVASVVLLESRN